MLRLVKELDHGRVDTKVFLAKLVREVSLQRDTDVRLENGARAAWVELDARALLGHDSERKVVLDFESIDQDVHSEGLTHS